MGSVESVRSLPILSKALLVGAHGGSACGEVLGPFP